MPNVRRSFLLLHLIVFIWGFTGILGKLISLGSYQLTWYRTILAASGILVWLLFKRKSLRITGNAFLKFAGVGAIIALHWITFYEAIKVSNVSVALACFSCGALFAAFIEPFFFRRRIRLYEIFFGAIVIVCLWMISNVEAKYTWGILLSIVAAFTSALFGVLNGLLVKKHDAGVISFYELLAGFGIMTIFLLVTGDLEAGKIAMSAADLGWLLTLSLVCTSFTFVTSVSIMKEISPYTLVLTVNLESVYSIILAYFIFGDEEKMSLTFYLCTVVIIATVLANGWFRQRMERIKNGPAAS
ncbi:MAG: permease [Bacteroidetes bacterium]|nr:MAG: permease [Bacteroidota bacterium]